MNALLDGKLDDEQYAQMLTCYYLLDKLKASTSQAVTDGIHNTLSKANAKYTKAGSEGYITKSSEFSEILFTDNHVAIFSLIHALLGDNTNNEANISAKQLPNICTIDVQLKLAELLYIYYKNTGKLSDSHNLGNLLADAALFLSASTTLSEEEIFRKN